MTMGCGCGGGKRNITPINKSQVTKKHQLKVQQHDNQVKIKAGNRQNNNQILLKKRII